MSAAIRRMAIWHTLCYCRQITIQQLASKYQVCPRTIRYDIEALSPHYPIETVRGRYGGCVRLAEWYRTALIVNDVRELERYLRHRFLVRRY